MKRYRPGKGWSHLAGAVYEHRTGIRIHLGGVIRLSNKVVFMDHQISKRFWLYKKITGGNRKRALMALAIALEAE